MFVKLETKKPHGMFLFNKVTDVHSAKYHNKEYIVICYFKSNGFYTATKISKNNILGISIGDDYFSIHCDITLEAMNEIK